MTTPPNPSGEKFDARTIAHKCFDAADPQYSQAQQADQIFKAVRQALQQAYAQGRKDGDSEAIKWKEVVDEMCKDEQEIRDAFKKVFTEHEVEGDSYGVPCIVTLVEKLIAQLSAQEKEKE